MIIAILLTVNTFFAEIAKSDYNVIDGEVTTMTSYNEAIGKWLADRRESLGLQQSDVGERLGVTKSAVHYWETGKRTIKADTMLEYCKILDADPQELIRDVTKKAV